MTKAIKRKKPRFEVDTDGMRALQAGREPWQLVKELVSNAWDEPTVTRCDVRIHSNGNRKTVVEVFDDGAGFQKYSDAWVLMGHTEKRGDPTVRGRFNIGEKEIISVAYSASVQTRGHTITFPKSGGRRITKNTVTAGTTVTCVMPWGHRQAETIVERLKMLLPPIYITYTVNGAIVHPLEIYTATTGVLDTIIQTSPLEPLTATKRKTDINIYKPTNGTGYLYELGIPVQPIDCPYLVDIAQKVPLPPNRDMVRDSYLKRVYAAVLNATYAEIPTDNMSASWVRQAIESGKADGEAVRHITEQRYGKHVLLASTDKQSNQRAVEAGYTVVHPKTLSPDEREQIVAHTNMQHTSRVFPSYTKGNGDIKDYTLHDKDLTPGMLVIRAFSIAMGNQLIGRTIDVRFYRNKADRCIANWGANQLGFNVSHCGRAFFDDIGEAQIGTVLHELAHCEGNWHDGDWQRSFNRLSGRAVLLALKRPELFTVEHYKNRLHIP